MLIETLPADATPAAPPGRPSSFAIEVPDALLGRARAGEQAAFEQVYRRFERPVFTLALRICGEREAAADVLQETMLKVFAHDAEGAEGLRAVLEAPTLYDEFLRYLARWGHAVPERNLERDWSKPHVSDPALLPVFERIYGRSLTADDLLERFVAIVDAVEQIPEAVGWCWTELADVEQEINGLLTADRRPKVDPARLRAALEQLPWSVQGLL